MSITSYSQFINVFTYNNNKNNNDNNSNIEYIMYILKIFYYRDLLTWILIGRFRVGGHCCCFRDH